MGWFPFFIQLDGACGLLVGGGQVALRKAEKLLGYGPRLTVVAPEICPQLVRLAGRGGIAIKKRPFQEDDLCPAPAFVIAATGDRALNHTIAALCRQRGVLVNVVDDLGACGFLFPALVRRGALSVGISTGGASPTVAVWLKEKIEGLLPANFGEILERLSAYRAGVRAETPNQPARAQQMRERLAMELSGGEAAPEGRDGRVALVGAGCGKADLITLRGLRLLRQCRAVVYDDLIDQALLEEAPPQARRVYVGKRSGRHGATQEEINRLLVDLAGEGGLVVRLKGGDPYVFGRGGEEALALRKAGIGFEVVPGITSAIGIPSEAGIPVTHRGTSRAVHIITAHAAPGEGLELGRYANLEGTLVFLMGARRLGQIARELIQGGMPADTPAAVLSGGNAPHPGAVRAPLGELARAAERAGVEPPAVVVVGAAAAMDLTDKQAGEGAAAGGAEVE